MAQLETGSGSELIPHHLRCPCSTPGCKGRGARGLSLGPGCGLLRVSQKFMNGGSWLAQLASCLWLPRDGWKDGVGQSFGVRSFWLSLPSLPTAKSANILETQFPHLRNGKKIASPSCCNHREFPSGKFLNMKARVVRMTVAMIIAIRVS